MTTPTIPLHQLQCYLDYGLTGQAEIKYSSTETKWVDCELLGMFTDGYLTIQCYDTTTYKTKWDTVTKSSLLNFRPSVIPLTSLTDEQWRDVFKAGFIGPDHENFANVEVFRIEDVGVSVIYSGVELRFSFRYKSFYHWPVGFYELAAFQKLFSLHADVFGWIDAQLAIDKTKNNIWKT